MRIIVFLITLNFVNISAQEGDCLKVLEKALCLGDYQIQPGDMTPERYLFAAHLSNTRKCSPIPAATKQKVLKAFSYIPKELKPFICNIKKVFLEKETKTTAFADNYTVRDPSSDRPPSEYDTGEAFKREGFVMGLSLPKLVDNKNSLKAWLLQKEVTAFGLKFGSQPPMDFPYFDKYNYKGLPQDLQLLVETITHELAHHVDFANNVSKTTIHCLQTDPHDCQVIQTGSFASLSFGLDGQWRDEVAFFDSPPCYYIQETNNGSCRPIDLSRADSFYQGFLDNSSFISTYAAVSSREDFAEVMAFYLLNRDYDLEYSIKIPSLNRSFDLRSFFGPISLRSIKFDFIQNLFLRSNLDYGGGAVIFYAPYFQTAHFIRTKQALALP